MGQERLLGLEQPKHYGSCEILQMVSHLTKYDMFHVIFCLVSRGWGNPISFETKRNAYEPL